VPMTNSSLKHDTKEISRKASIIVNLNLSLKEGYSINFGYPFFVLHRLMLPLVQLSLIISREIKKQENKLRLGVSYVRARSGVCQFSILHYGKYLLRIENDNDFE